MNYSWDNRITFSHLFLKGWDPTREVNAYPPGLGPLALYNKNDFYETIDYAIRGVSRIYFNCILFLSEYFCFFVLYCLQRLEIEFLP